MKTLYVRPVYEAGDGRLLGLALCKTNGPLLVDEQVVGHFGGDDGLGATRWAEELGCKAEWGTIIEVTRGKAKWSA